MFYPHYPIFCLYTENDGAIMNFGQTHAWTNPWYPKMIAWSPPTSDYIIEKSIPLTRFIYQSSGLNGMICSGYIEPPVVRINVPPICLRNLMNDDGQYEVEFVLCCAPTNQEVLTLTEASLYINQTSSSLVVDVPEVWAVLPPIFCVTEVCVLAILCGFLVSGGESSGSKGDWWRVGVLGTGWRIVFFFLACAGSSEMEESLIFFELLKHIYKVHVSKGSYDKVRAEKDIGHDNCWSGLATDNNRYVFFVLYLRLGPEVFSVEVPKRWTQFQRH